MSPAACVAAGLVPPGGAPFNPTTSIPGLLWLLHPDDATDVISGQINSLVDRKAGATFTAPSATNRLILDTTERPGHNVATDNSGSRFLRNSTLALAAALEGDVDCSAFLFWKPTNFSAAARPISHSNSAISRAVSFATQSGTNAGYGMLRADASTSSTLAVATVRTAAVWQFVVWTYTAATGVWESFIDNVSKGTNTFASIAPAGLTQINWGAKTAIYSISGVTTNVMSSTVRTNLYNWIQAGGA